MLPSSSRRPRLPRGPADVEPGGRQHRRRLHAGQRQLRLHRHRPRPDHGRTDRASEALPPGDYLVQVDAPKDANNRPAYEVVKEEDINIFSGDEFVAPGETPLNPPLPNRTPPTTVVPAIPPFPCAGPQHTVNVVSDWSLAQLQPAGPREHAGRLQPGHGRRRRQPLRGPAEAAVRHPPRDRPQRPLGHPELPLQDVHGFDAAGNALPAGAGVPLPGRIFGIVVDDLNLSTNPKELFYGEKYGIPNMPIGIYDFSNRLVKTIQTDPQGAVRGHPALDVQLQLPAAGRPVPGDLPLPGERSRPARAPEPGLQPGLPDDRRLLRGVAGRQPAVRPGADPGRVRDREPRHPADASGGLPPERSRPADGIPRCPSCSRSTSPGCASTTPGQRATFTLTGQYFGAAPGSVTARRADDDHRLVERHRDPVHACPAAGPTLHASGPYQLKITGSNGQSTVNGLTFHVLSR